MTSPDLKSDCIDARLYYHDFLSDQTKCNIPKDILDHINGCRNCRKHINQLESILAEADEDSKQSQQNTAITTILRLHFAYINKSVTCSIVKPFLPSLVIPDLKIRIPTPITTHLDKCSDCSNDLSMIRNFELNQRQLFRLGRLLSDKPIDDTINCSKAQLALQSVVSMKFHKTNAEILKHFCICPDCRKLLYKNREALRNEFLKNRISQNEFPCRQVSRADIFSYCIPYGIDPANDEYAEFRESLTSHLNSCPSCLDKMQQLHTDIYNIVEREDSEIITCFTFHEQDDQAVESEFNSEFADLPINVQIINRKKLTDTSYIEKLRQPEQKHKQRTRIIKLKKFIGPAMAAAAVILIGFALLSTPTAKAMTLEQIYQAVEKAKNVCISSFKAGHQEPWQTVWISRLMRTRLVETKERNELLNLQNWTIKTTDISNGFITETFIQPNMRRKFENSLSGSFGLLPFSDISAIKKGAQWKRVDNENITDLIPGTKVFDLTWTKITDRHTMYYKWRVFIDNTTTLPIRVEWYQKMANDKEYTLQTTDVVQYPTDNEIKTIIHSAFN